MSQVLKQSLKLDAPQTQILGKNLCENGHRTAQTNKTEVLVITSSTQMGSEFLKDTNHISPMSGPEHAQDSAQDTGLDLTQKTVQEIAQECASEECDGTQDEQITFSIAWVSRKIGVAGSTLRSWEQRYGMAPSLRTRGTHRRYTAQDVERLMKMKDLIAQGLRPSQAAAAVLSKEPLISTHNFDLTDFENRVIADECETLRAALSGMIAREGLGRVWEEIINPTLNSLSSTPRCYPPGVDPAATLGNLVMEILQKNCTIPPDRLQLPILLISDRGRRLTAHVTAAELARIGFKSSVFLPEKDQSASSDAPYAPSLEDVKELISSQKTKDLSKQIDEYKVKAVVGIIGPMLCRSPLPRRLDASPDIATVMLEPGATLLSARCVARVRTVMAAVNELAYLAKMTPFSVGN